jgi:hypothetical protein
MLDGLVLGWWGSLGGGASNEDDELLDAYTSTVPVSQLLRPTPLPISPDPTIVGLRTPAEWDCFGW